jgi:phosphate-selective porin OprO/OprP
MKYTKILLIKLLALSCFIGANLLQADEGLSLKAKGKETIELRFNGRMQAQYDSLSMTDEPSTNHFYFRRLFLGAKAKLSNGIYAESVFDFAGDENPEVAFDKAIIGYKFSNGVTGVLGFQKVPFGYEETTSSSKLQTIERSAINRFFADDIDFSSRHMGVHAKGKLDNGFSYALAIVNSAQGEGSRLGGISNTSTDMAYFARLQWKQDDITFGIDYGDQKGNTELSTIDNEGNDATNLITNRVDVSAYTSYINYKSGDLNLLGEYFSGDLGEGNDTEGYSLRASIRNGKWEPVIRYSSVESDWKVDSDELIRRAPSGGDLSGLGGELDSTYVGLNYYYSKAVTFMAGYEDAESTDGTTTYDMDGLRARVQVLW